MVARLGLTVITTIVPEVDMRSSSLLNSLAWQSLKVLQWQNNLAHLQYTLAGSWPWLAHTQSCCHSRCSSLCQSTLSIHTSHVPHCLLSTKQSLKQLFLMTPRNECVNLPRQVRVLTTVWGPGPLECSCPVASTPTRPRPPGCCTGAMRSTAWTTCLCSSAGGSHPHEATANRVLSDGPDIPVIITAALHVLAMTVWQAVWSELH